MMPTKAQVDVVVDTKDVDRMLGAFADAVSPTQLEALLAGGVAQRLRYRAQNRFNSEGDSASGKWAPLRPATEEIREFLGYPRAHPINERTGALRAFITGSTGDVKGAIDGAELTWPGKAGGDLNDKLAVAQGGSPRGSNPWFCAARTPARPVVAIDQLDVAEVLAAFASHLETSMRTGGFSVTPL